MGRRKAGWACVGLVLLSFAWAFWHNRAFVGADAMLRGITLNDVDSIFWGYQATPNLLRDGLRWWHGTWIQYGIRSWRPMSSYVYWTDCYLADRFGRWTWGWFGLLLLVAETWAAVWLAWRLTRWRPSAIIAGLLLPVQCRIAGTYPSYWLYWFPVHQEIVTATAMLLTLALFDTWLERGGGRRLAVFWLAFLLACATKETCFILPGMLAALAAWRRFPDGPLSRRTVWGVVLALCASVLGLWLWRAACVPGARNPTILLIQIPRKLGLALLCPVFRYGLGGEWGVPLVPVTATGLYFWWKHRRPRWWLFWPVAWAAVMVPVYIWPGKSFVDLFLPLFDIGPMRWSWFEILVIVWSLLLYWRYRHSEPTAAMVACLVLVYVPNIDYIGWHYEVVPWSLRAVNWALLAKLTRRYLWDEGHAAWAWRHLGEAVGRLAQARRIRPA